MGIEIDMLSVGNADALTVYISDGRAASLIVIDGGNPSDGEKVVEHVKTWFPSKQVNLLISTHPDKDHIGGLPTIIDELAIQQVWIHDPSAFAEQIKSFTSTPMAITLREQVDEAVKSLNNLKTVIALIDKKQIPRQQPFTGLKCQLAGGAVLTVAGPTQDFYSNLATRLKSHTVKEAARSDRDVVNQTNDGSPFNNSSVITIIEHEAGKYLFTADAGPSAFSSACENSLVNLANMTWMQVPHHGSRGNITTDLIEYFNPCIAFVSASGADDIHPNPAVVRCLQDCTCEVYGTYKSGSLYHRSEDVPMRPGYQAAIPLSRDAD